MQTLGTRTEPLQMPLQATFRDGLGTRYLWDGAGGPLEVLTLHPHLGAITSFESLIHERVTRLAQFREPCYVRVRDVEHDAASSRLAVVSDHVAGVRLSRMLTMAEQQLLPLDVASALCLIRQVLSAVATLHEATPDTWHGALGADRIVVTPDARVVIMEHVFGSALEHLEWSPERYWKDLRIALPREKECRFTRRGDVYQAGVVAMSLLLGRPLGDDEYPEGLGDLAGGTYGLGGGFDPLPQWLRGWLSRALWLDPSRAFKTAAEARQAFETGLAQAGANASEDALQAFLTQYEASSAAQPQEPIEGDETPAPSALASVMPAAVTTPVVAQLVSPAPSPKMVTPAPTPQIVTFTPKQSHPEPPKVSFELPADEPREEEIDVLPSSTDSSAGFMTSGKGRMVAAAVVLVALTSGGVAARRYLATPAAAAPSTGRLVIQSNPAGATVTIDGQNKGVTPLTVSLNAGAHRVELSAEGSNRTLPVTITANAEVSQFIEMPRVAPVVGQLDVRTDPTGARVTVDGQRKGTTPVTVTGLTPGKHVVLLENDLGAVTEDVTIEAGSAASLVVPMRTPQGAPVSGWLSLTVPAEVQIFEGDRLLGSSRSDRIMVATGKHDLVFVNDALGYRSTQSVQVTPGQVARVKPDWPQGTIAINAAPWANVWLDGQELGETPVGNTQVPVGTHEVIFRHPQLGEQKYTATVTTTAPTRLSVDMRKK